MSYQQQGTPRDNGVFAVGIAAHTMLEFAQGLANNEGKEPPAALINDVAKEVELRLCAKGRDNEGPLKLTDVREGISLAMRFIENGGLRTGVYVELALAYDAEWSIVPWMSHEMRFATMLDRVYIEDVETEESSYRAVFVDDYKTSWACSQDDLDSIQQQAQVVAIYNWLKPEDEVEVIVHRLFNLRTGQVFTREYQLDTDWGIEALNKAEDDLNALMAYADEMQDDAGSDGARRARPGSGCLTCPYATKCEVGQDHFNGSGIPSTPAERAVAYVALKGMLAEIEKLVKVDAKEAPIPVGDSIVGYQLNVKQAVRKDAMDDIREAWAAAGGDDAGLLAVIGSVDQTRVKKIAKKLHDSRDDQEAFVESMCEKKTTKNFGAWAVKP
jgi:hypothetical protein